MAERKTDKKSGARSGRARQVADIVPAVGRAAFRRFGFVESAIVARWSEIVGDVYARHCAPDLLRFPQGKRADGVLTIVVESAFAPTLAHVEPQIIERVNRFFGYAAIKRLVLKHGEPARAARGSKPAPPLTPAPLSAELSSTLRLVADPGLRATLEGLAQQISVTKGPPVFD